MQAMPTRNKRETCRPCLGKGHPGPFRLLSAGFGLGKCYEYSYCGPESYLYSPRSAKGGTAAIPLYGSFY